MIALGRDNNVRRSGVHDAEKPHLSRKCRFREGAWQLPPQLEWKGRLGLKLKGQRAGCSARVAGERTSTAHLGEEVVGGPVGERPEGEHQTLGGRILQHDLAEVDKS
eukprot:7284196-Alexandrium_andersonii.AAC.1